MSILPKLSFRFNEIPMKLPSRVFTDIDKLMTQRDVMGREVGGGFMFGNACKN